MKKKKSIASSNLKPLKKIARGLGAYSLILNPNFVFLDSYQPIEGPESHSKQRFYLNSTKRQPKKCSKLKLFLSRFRKKNI